MSIVLLVNAAQIRALTSAERRGLPADIQYRAGNVALTAGEASVLEVAMTARPVVTPADAERARINALYAAAERAINATDDDNVERSMRLRAQADAALAAWRAKYPEAAREERKAKLIASAQHERDMASGALTYDADGWLSREDQQRRHDEHIAKATELEAQAASL